MDSESPPEHALPPPPDATTMETDDVEEKMEVQAQSPMRAVALPIMSASDLARIKLRPVAKKQEAEEEEEEEELGDKDDVEMGDDDDDDDDLGEDIRFVQPFGSACLFSPSLGWVQCLLFLCMKRFFLSWVNIHLWVSPAYFSAIQFMYIS